MKASQKLHSDNDFESQKDLHRISSSKGTLDSFSATSFLSSTRGKVLTILVVVGYFALAIGLAIGVYFSGSRNAPILDSTLSPLLQAANSAIDSRILTPQDKLNLLSFSNIKSFKLVYRGSRDGFDAHIFHQRCDNLIGTLVIYLSNYNSVFGGLTTQVWNSINSYRSDSNAFIFSLRRRGFINSERFNVTSPSNAIYCAQSYHATFGGYDIYVNDNCDVLLGSHSSFCNSYQCPTSSSNNQQYLAGNSNGFLVTEIEVYQVSF